MPTPIDPNTMPPTPSQAHTPWFKDKSLFLVVASFVVPLLNKKLGWHLDPETLAAAIGAAAVFIFSSKWRSKVVTTEEIKAKNAVQVAQITTGTTYTTPEGAAKALESLTQVPRL